MDVFQLEGECIRFGEFDVQPIAEAVKHAAIIVDHQKYHCRGRISRVNNFRACAAAGMAAHLAKPISLARLARVIGDHCAR